MAHSTEKQLRPVLKFEKRDERVQRLQRDIRSRCARDPGDRWSGSKEEPSPGGLAEKSTLREYQLQYNNLMHTVNDA